MPSCWQFTTDLVVTSTPLRERQQVTSQILLGLPPTGPGSATSNLDLLPWPCCSPSSRILMQSRLASTPDSTSCHASAACQMLASCCPIRYVNPRSRMLLILCVSWSPPSRLIFKLQTYADGLYHHGAQLGLSCRVLASLERSRLHRISDLPG